MSSRRKLPLRDLSTSPDNSSIARNAQGAQIFLNTVQLTSLADSTILERSLSLNSVISTTSSFSRLAQTASTQPHLQQINQIGIGLQGVVFEQIGNPAVLKKEKSGNETLHSNLRHEYEIHCEVSSAFGRYRLSTNSEVLVPKALRFVPKAGEDLFWNEMLPKIPMDYRTRCDSMIMQRILPLPKIVRQALINEFCTGDAIQASKLLDDPRNKHCLARVYLGKTNGPVTHEHPLRNFPLYLDFMKKIGLNTTKVATALGESYAILHWGACVNADDVEFVFGTTAEHMSSEQARPDLQHRAVGLFLLDFGQCDTVDLDQDTEDVYQAFKGAMVTGDNQYFIPRPNQPLLFAAFKKGYIETTKIVLADKNLSDKFDAERFMQQYEEYAEDLLY